MARGKYGFAGIYNASPITLADQEGCALAVDVNGRLVVSASASTADQSTFTPATTAGTISMGVYETTPETLSNNQAAAIGIDVNRNVKTTMATLLAGENLTTNRLNNEPIYSFLNIVLAAPTTTVVKSGAGTLHSITFNKPVATGTVTIYDNTAASGTLIGTITTPASPMPVTLFYDDSFATGLTIVTATAAQDITVSYR